MRAAVLHCGGNVDRIRTTRRVWRGHPSRGPDWTTALVISGEPGVHDVAVHLAGLGFGRRLALFDFRPWDTLTHFTAVVDELAADGVTELHVVTDRFHLRRAVLVARLVCWRRGIRVIGHPHDDPAQSGVRDPWLRLLKDVVRALAWRLTGHLMFDASIRRRRQADALTAAAEARALGLRVLDPLPLSGADA